MYFTQFDSYVTTIDQARVFVIVVVLTDGTTIESSSVPVGGWDEVLADLTEFWATKSTFAIWNNKTKAVTMVNYDHVRAISIRWEHS